MPKTPIIVMGKRPIWLKDYDPGSLAGFKNKAQAMLVIEKRTKEMGAQQGILYPQGSYGILVITHGADTAGKSTLIKKMMTEISATGASVASFKAPTSEELSHDYLWRHMAHLPKRGQIVFFDRSYYEEVCAVRVHPEFLERQRIPHDLMPKRVWKSRFRQISNFEEYLLENGIVVIKLYLNLSKEEQKKRLLSRLKRPHKSHKYSRHDLEERKYFDKYNAAAEDFINRTSTPQIPWHILPADNKWVTRALAAEIIAKKMRSLDLRIPVMDEKERRKELRELQAALRKENGKKKRKKK